MIRRFAALVVLVLLGSWTLKADVAPFPSWRIAANDSIVRAVQAGPAVYVSGRFTKLGRAVAPFTAILNPNTLALSPGTGCAAGGSSAGSGYVIGSTRLSDGAGPYVVPPGTKIVRIKNDCRFDRGFHVVLPAGAFPDDTYNRVVESGGRIYFEASYGAFTPAFVRLIIEADQRTGALLRHWPVASTYPVHLEGAVPDGRVVASSRRPTGEPTVGWFDTTSGTYLEVRTLSDGIRRSHVGSVVVLAIFGSSGDQVLALDAAMLAPLPQWPAVQANFTALTSGGGRVFVSGKDVAVDGVAASQLLAFDAVTGARDAAWSAPPWVDDPRTSFSTLTASGGRVIAIGDSAPGAPRDALAAFDAVTGALDAWTATEVPTIATLVDGRLLLSVSARDRVARAGIAALDPATGTVLPWNPSGVTTSGSVLAVDTAGGYLYSSGGDGVRRWHLATGNSDATWQLDVQTRNGQPGQVADIALLGGTVYAVGMFANGRDGAAAPWQPREGALSIAAAGTLTPWRPRLLETCVVYLRTPFSVPCVTRVLAAEGRIVLSGFLQSLDSRWTPNRSALAFTADTADLDPLVPVAPLGTVGALAADASGLYAAVALSRPSLAVMSSQSGARVIGPIASTELTLPAGIAVHGGRLYARAEHDAGAGQPTGNPHVWGSLIGVEGGVLDFGPAQGEMVWHADIAPVAPRPPANVTASLDGALVTLRWEPGEGDLRPLIVPPPPGGTAATAHVVSASLTAGGAPVAQLDTASADPSFSIAAPAGTFYVRVQARNAFGTSAPSEEIRVDVQPQPPDQPAATVASVQGRTARIEWQAPPRGWPATGYVLDAGTAPGLTDIGSLPVSGTSFQTTVPPGRYYVRVRAVNASGASAPGDEVILDVP